ncbi:PAS domain-containing serine/threonine-protein kinase-like [Limulus polyphemus]|uniref:PAS domain-containing serine/threonine-protein kinase-like n=1 Tax=Limulus polyphemus TaxID=6850 RepID=A0ABM1SFW2_LIMPO|nr:PAS domain-containing serine/threonine-protein kinase-like [Limulus polyphemus]XP_022242517.1 PAS domain-containing serine/threonine-protein kinase-like [Limulus polyphemus]
MGDHKKCTLDKFRGDALNTFSFAASHSKGSFANISDASYHARSLSESWVFYSFIGGVQISSNFSTKIQNPNKAIVTINARTTEILVANKMACQLFGVNGSELHGKKLCDFFSKRKGQYILTETELESNGELVVISGKILDLIDAVGDTTPVSVWARQLPEDDEPRCVVVMEPVERTTASVTFTPQGVITNCDYNFATLCGYLNPADAKHHNIRDIIPSVVLPPTDSCGKKIPKDIRKQQATGRTRDGATFPLSILIEPLLNIDAIQSEELTSENHSEIQFLATIWVFANISGMITVFPDGTIHSCNANFSLMLFGYSQSQLVGKNISNLIPSFYDDLEFLDTDSMPLPPLDDDDDDDDSHVVCPSDGRTTAESIVTDPPRPTNPVGKQIDLMLEDIVGSVQGLALSRPKPTSTPVLSPESSVTESLTSSRSTDVHSFNGKPSVFLEESNHCISAPVSMNPVDDKKQPCKTTMSLPITNLDFNEDILDKQTAELVVTRDNSQSTGSSENTKSANLCTENRQDAFGFSSEDIGTGSSTKPESSVNGWITEFGDYQIKQSESFHSTSTTTASTIHSSTESAPTDFVHVNTDAMSTKGNAALPFEQLAKEVLSCQFSNETVLSIPEGNYFGIGRHRDGSDLAIVYQIKKVDLDDGQTLYCLWVSRDPEEVGEGGRQFHSFNLASSFNSTLGVGLDASTQSLQQQSLLEKSVSQSLSVSQSAAAEPPDTEYVKGSYADHYTTLQQIGKGAFGCVKMAFRNTDGVIVVTKFIRKAKVYEECWVFDSIMGKRVPLEVSLLTTLKHPSIVQVIDVYENEKYFQMVMEKHGSGMDLFEFIDRSPNLDEALASYIFRQVVSALSYMHSLNILHRDVKDENIILDQYFHAKLIDFGSASFMAADRYFSTFCGTMEYCSPEVLKGNKYRGPELEMWALGVTLYTLVFGENPFFDVDETIAAVLRPPFKVSNDLTDLISWLLHPDPQHRCTLSEVEKHPWTTQEVCPENYNFENVVRTVPEEIDPPMYYHMESSSHASVVPAPELASSKTVEFGLEACGKFTRTNSSLLIEASSYTDDQEIYF